MPPIHPLSVYSSVFLSLLPFDPSFLSVRDQSFPSSTRSPPHTHSLHTHIAHQFPPFHQSRHLRDTDTYIPTPPDPHGLPGELPSAPDSLWGPKSTRGAERCVVGTSTWRDLSLVQLSTQPSISHLIHHTTSSRSKPTQTAHGPPPPHTHTIPRCTAVYDLADNSKLYWLGQGIYHSGVEVYGCEFAFGGHDGSQTGVFSTPPKACLSQGQVAFRQSFDLGETTLSPAAVEKLIIELGDIFRGNRYHLLQRNCNHFADELVAALTKGKARAPKWVNRTAKLAVSLHCLIPTQYIPIPPLEPPLHPNHQGPPPPSPKSNVMFTPPTANDQVR